MKGFYSLSLLLVTICAIQHSKSESQPDFEHICIGKEDGVMVRDPISYAQSYFCISDRPVDHVTCRDEGQWFDEKTQNCVDYYKIPVEDCPNRCNGKKNGYVVAPNSKCKQYYNCLDGKIVGNRMTCGPADTFDIKMEICVRNDKNCICEAV